MRVFKLLILIIPFCAINIIFITLSFPEIFDSNDYGFVISFFSLPMIPICLFLLMFTDLHMKKKIILIAYTLLLFPLGFFGFMGLHECSIKRFFYSRQDKLNEFVNDISEYDSIFQMTDGLRAALKINNKFITFSYDDTGVTKYNQNYVHYYLELLEKEGLDSITYEQFRNKLINLNVISFEEKIGFIYFEKDGFLNTCSGYLYVKGDVPPVVGREETFCGTIENLLKLSDKWYYFVT